MIKEIKNWYLSFIYLPAVTFYKNPEWQMQFIRDDASLFIYLSILNTTYQLFSLFSPRQIKDNNYKLNIQDEK